MKKIKYIILSLVSLLFGISMSLEIVIKKNGIDNFIKKFQIDFSFILTILLLGISFYILMILLFKLFDKYKLNNKKYEFNNKKLKVISFSMIFTFSMLLLLTFYPGSMLSDFLEMVAEPVYHSALCPYFYAVIVSYLFRILAHFFSDAITIFIISIIQIVIIDCIITHVICWFNKKIQNKILTIILLCYYSLYPVILSYNVALLRDSIFGTLVLLIITYLYDLISSDGKVLLENKYIFGLPIIMGITSLIRNNGIYIFLLVIILILIKYKKYYMYIIPEIIILIMVSNLTILIPKVYRPAQLYREKIAIPIQQIALSLKEEKDTFNSSEIEYLEQILPIETFISKYNPKCVDPVKWNTDFNNKYLDRNSTEFMKIWFRHLSINTEKYFKAYILNNMDLLFLDKVGEEQSIILGVDKRNEEVLSYYNIKFRKIMPNFMNKFYKYTTVTFNNGALFWILMIVCLYMIFSNKPKYLLICTPLIGNWLTLMIASPLSSALRYMYPFVICLPLIICLMIGENEKCIKKKKSK